MADTNESDDQQDQGQGCHGCGTSTGGCTDPNRHGLI